MISTTMNLYREDAYMEEKYISENTEITETIKKNIEDKQYNEFKKNISDENLNKIYFFQGEEYLIEYFEEKLKNKPDYTYILG